MSYVNKEILKGNLDPSLPFFTTTLSFTTSQVLIDTLTQYQAYIKSFRIVNNDVANSLTYRQGSRSEPLKTVPLISEVFVDGWESFIEINPNAGTGTGFIELDLIDRKVAERT